jgi:hypothetical protein
MNSGTTTEACQPYKNVAGQCGFNCVNQATPYKMYKCKPDTLKLVTKTDDIKTEIMTNGPALFALNVYDDFFSYSTGVYTVTSTKNMGGH